MRSSCVTTGRVSMTFPVSSMTSISLDCSAAQGLMLTMLLSLAWIVAPLSGAGLRTVRARDLVRAHLPTVFGAHPFSDAQVVLLDLGVTDRLGIPDGALLAL